MAKKPHKTKKIKHSIKPQRGKISGNLIVIVVGIIVLGIGAWFLKPWESLPFMKNTMNGPVAVAKPTMDMGRARQLTLDPQKDNVMQIVTKEKVRVTLEVPKGAIKEKTTIQLIPFFHDKKSEAPTSGVAISPASVTFTVPVTLSFNFSDSTLRNQAPKTVLEKKVRTTGLSQVMQVDANASSLTPMLVARGMETESYLPARILTGGAYVFSLDGKHQVQIAKKALDTEGMNTLIVMEAATTLLFNGEKLSDTEMKKTKAAVVKILSQKEPPALELYAALVLQKKINTPSFSLIPKAYAYETGEGFFQAVCREDKYTIEQYIGYAKSAQMMGYDSIGDSCLNRAKNKVAEEAQKLIAGNPDMKSIMVAIQNVQLLGLDSETNLEGQLIEKAKEVATQGARKVADDPNSSAIDAAIEMQKMESVGADSGPTYEKLKQKINDILDAQEKAAEQASEEYQRDEAKREAELDKLAEEAEKKEEELREKYEDEAIQQEEILYNAAMSQLGIGFLKLFGFEELDKESLQKKFDEMNETAKKVVEAGFEFCAAARAEGVAPDNCEATMQHAQSLQQQAEQMSYRAVQEIGQAQSGEYEPPEYTENNGDFKLYFEEELTPTPGEGEEGMEVDGYNEEEETTSEEDNGWGFDDYGPQGQSTTDETETSEESYYESGLESSGGESGDSESTGYSEEVMGAKTNKWWIFSW